MIAANEISTIKLAFAEDSETGGYCGPVLVTFYAGDEFYLPCEVEHGEELVGFSGCAGECEVIARALRLFPNAIVIDDDGNVHKGGAK